MACQYLTSRNEKVGCEKDSLHSGTLLDLDNRLKMATDILYSFHFGPFASIRIDSFMGDFRTGPFIHKGSDRTVASHKMEANQAFLEDLPYRADQHQMEASSMACFHGYHTDLILRLLCWCFDFNLGFSSSEKHSSS